MLHDFALNGRARNNLSEAGGLFRRGSEARDVALALDGATPVGARAVTLTGSADAENSLESPTAVSPSDAVASVTSGHYTLPPRSVVVLRVRIS